MKNNDKKLVAKIRKIRKCGGSYYIALPQQWIKKHDLKEGDKMPVLADSIVKIVPMQEIE